MDDIPRFVVGAVREGQRRHGHEQPRVPGFVLEIPHLSPSEFRCAAAFCLDDEQAPFEALREQHYGPCEEGL